MRLPKGEDKKFSEDYNALAHHKEFPIWFHSRYMNLSKWKSTIMKHKRGSELHYEIYNRETKDLETNEGYPEINCNSQSI
ncbi:hypothetical protein VNO78_28701 [Psophocarpus tetragonolobus]|uniref:Uncharacterized protein n=1 Tax=Psophocarpus tetragonolobus TaxID=3891 RepID=A0AAN9RU53_PSOTE